MRSTTILRLGRVSNLPTVWTNTMAASWLAGGGPLWSVVIAALILSLFYLSGMWLNDAFDATVDAAERADRPIPNGEITRLAVFVVGGVLMALALLLTLPFGLFALIWAVGLAATILLYDWLHKGLSLAPLLMGTTRYLSYALAAAAVAGSFGVGAQLGAFGLFAHVVGITYAARQEAYDRIGQAWPLAVLSLPALTALALSGGRPLALAFIAALAAATLYAVRLLWRRQRGDVPRAVVTLIAGIALYDGALLAGADAWPGAVLALAFFGLTLWLQRVASGT